MRDWLPTLIALCGWHSLAFAVFHIGFWKLFGWPGSLRSTTYPNRAIIQILNLRLIWVLFGFAAALLLWPDDIVQTRLGRGLLGFMAPEPISLSCVAATPILRANAKEEAVTKTGRLGQADDAGIRPLKRVPHGFGPKPALAAARSLARSVGYDLRRAPCSLPVLATNAAHAGE